MAVKKILTVGFNIASNDTYYIEFNSKASLLDGDIILFKPVIDYFLTPNVRYDGLYEFPNYKGKPQLNEKYSFQLVEHCQHWCREINDAVKIGKTVIIFLSALQEVYIDTGKRNNFRTERNPKIEIMVTPYNNYNSIPLQLKPISTTGSEIKLSSRNIEVISNYWKEFEELSQYKVILTEENIPACLITKNGDKAVGAIYRNKNSSGTLILLPDIDFYSNDFLKQEDYEEFWTTEGKKFASRMLSAVIALDKSLKITGESTSEPQWASNPNYALNQEIQLKQKLVKAEEELKKAQNIRNSIIEELKKAQKPRELLFEKGKPLENAIINGLKILGFCAVPFKNSHSEFDVIFESEEGRLIGEVEGKDNKAINIEKFRQLSTNITEDLQRKEVSKPAKGVLFGNAYRLLPPDNRETAFTEKCINSAESSSTALVSTLELFRVVQYLLNNPDEEYAKSCRKAIVEGVGIVKFPSVQEIKGETELQQVVDSDT